MKNQKKSELDLQKKFHLMTKIERVTRYYHRFFDIRYETVRKYGHPGWKLAYQLGREQFYRQNPLPRELNDLIEDIVWKEYFVKLKKLSETDILCSKFYKEFISLLKELKKDVQILVTGLERNLPFSQSKVYGRRITNKIEKELISKISNLKLENSTPESTLAENQEKITSLEATKGKLVKNLTDLQTNKNSLKTQFKKTEQEQQQDQKILQTLKTWFFSPKP